MKMNINVEEGIALGKTTLIKNLEKMVSSKIQGELEVITEPVKEWRDVAGRSYSNFLLLIQKSLPLKHKSTSYRQ